MKSKTTIGLKSGKEFKVDESYNMIIKRMEGEKFSPITTLGLHNNGKLISITAFDISYIAEL